MVNIKGKFSQVKGDAGEQAAALQLQALGLRMIRTGSNRWRVIGWQQRMGGRGYGIAKVIPEPRQKDEADWRAVEPGTGRSVFIEVKAREGRLRWSDLQPHQRATLTRHSQHGGLSLLVWVDGSDVRVMRWPVPGFKPRHSVTPEMAQEAAYRPGNITPDDMRRALYTLQDEAERVYLKILQSGAETGREFPKLRQAIVDAGRATGIAAHLWEYEQEGADAAD